MDELAAALKSSVSILERAHIPYALGGGAACWARGGPPSTRDVDLMVKPPDADRALEALGDAGMRIERPPEQWLYKAYDDEHGGVLVDLIFEPAGMEVDDELFARADVLNVQGMRVRVMSVDDVLVTKLLALDEHSVDYVPLLQIARALREQVAWDEVRARAWGSPYARGFFTLVEGLGIADRAREPHERATHVRVAR